MFAIGGGFIVFMATKAGKSLVISRLIVTTGTLAPLTGMTAAKNGKECVMIAKKRRLPANQGMALVTLQTEPRPAMIGVGRLRILRSVTVHALRGLQQKTAVLFITMAAITVQRSMGAQQAEGGIFMYLNRRKQ